jgi:hypothetical protein
MCIIIAGMHRSGTSAMARLVNLLGADITKDLAPGLPGINDRGFWESNAIHPIHDRLLEELGSSWHDPFPLPSGWLETAAALRARLLIDEELRKDFSDSALFVVKDPRIARLLPLWLRVLGEAAIEPVVVIPFRNPLEVALSLEKRDGFPLAKSVALYIRSNLEVELASRGQARVFHPYEQLVSDWRTLAQRLAAVVGPSVITAARNRAADIDCFLADGLRHHRVSSDDLAGRQDLALTAMELHDRLCEAATGDRAPLRPSFDRLRATMEEATKLGAGLMSASDRRPSAALHDGTGERETCVGDVDAEA